MDSFFVGLDVGGTSVRIASYDDSVNSIPDVKKVTFKRLGDARQEVDKNICELISAIVNEKSQENKRLRGIGLSLAALFDRISGEISMWPNNKVWDGFPLNEYLMEKFKVPVLMEDDANSAALGEHFAGAGKGYCNLAYITVSTGVGCGLILNNSLYTGSNGWAGEIGHIKVAEDGLLCRCGNNGCLQSLVSGPSLLEKINRIKISKGWEGFDTLDLKDVVNLACQGDKDAYGIFYEAGVHIGRMITNIVMLLDISLVILGGGVTGAGDLLLKPINKTLNDCLKHFKRNVEIKKSELGDSNGAIGALSLIYRQFNCGRLIQVK